MLLRRLVSHRSSNALRAVLRPSQPFQRSGVKYFSAAAGGADPTIPDVSPAVGDVVGDIPVAGDGLVDAAVAVAGAVPEIGWSPKFMVMQLIDNMHSFAGIPYWESIIAITLALRLIMLPLAIKGVANGARMALLKPEMQKVQDAFNKDPNSTDPRVKLRFQTDMKALFEKHKVNPLRAVALPLMQIPIFVSFFMALREMAAYYPGLATGGAYWFSNLAAADATMLFPIFNSITFLLMMELGTDTVAMEQKNTFKWVMRGLGVAMVPLTMDMPQAVFVYWSANNVLSLVQSGLLKNKALKSMLDIPEPPPNTAEYFVKPQNPFTNIVTAIKKEGTSQVDTKADVVDGSVPAAPVSGPPPVTFAQKPRK